MGLAELFPAAAVCCELWGPGDPATLLPEELACASGFAPVRLSEFAAARQCARRALADLGEASAPLLVGAGREPLWPAGIAGSITHTAGYSAAVVCRVDTVVSLGVDAERLVEMDRAEWQVLFRPTEIAWLDSLAQRDQLAMACALFSAKESYFKCQFPLTRRWLEFQDVELRFDSRSFFAIECEPERHWRIRGAYGFVGGSGIVATAAVATTYP
jgi:4'-phosphopantetheinyl transferase EntD